MGSRYTLHGVRAAIVAIVATIMARSGQAALCGEWQDGATCSHTGGGSGESSDGAATVGAVMWANQSSECMSWCQKQGIVNANGETTCCSFTVRGPERAVCNAIVGPSEIIPVSSLGYTAAICRKHGGQHKPHILFVVLDDAGHNDFDWMGSTRNQFDTPFLRGMATKGVLLKHHYAMPFRAPSRFALNTGRHPSLYGLQDANIEPIFRLGLPLGEKLMAQFFRENGYATHGFGKWHLGHSRQEQTPTFRGYDTWFGGFLGGADHFTHMKTQGTCTGYDVRDCKGTKIKTSWGKKGVYSTTLWTQQVRRTIEEHDTTKPLFMFLAYNAPHSPIQAPEEEIARFRSRYPDQPIRATLGAMMYMVDDAIKSISKALEDKLMWEDTITVVISDNGGVPAPGGILDGETESIRVGARQSLMHSNYPLRGGKGTVYEGGVRAMALVYSYAFRRSYPAKWKGIRKKARGTVYGTVFSIADWYPTLADVAGLGTPPYLQQESELDDVTNGVSHRKGIFLGRDDDVARVELLHAVHWCAVGENACGAIRIGDWKLAVGRWTNNFDRASWSIADTNRGTGYTGPSLGIEVTCGPPPTLEDNNVCRRNFCLFNISADPCEYTDLSAQYPAVVEELRDRLQQHYLRMVPTLPDEPSEGCDAVTIKGDWGLWDDYSIARQFREIASFGQLFGWRERISNAVFVRPWTQNTKEKYQCMRQCRDNDNCAAISMARWIGKVQCTGVSLPRGNTTECEWDECKAFVKRELFDAGAEPTTTSSPAQSPCRTFNQACLSDYQCCAPYACDNHREGARFRCYLESNPDFVPDGNICREAYSECSYHRQCCSFNCTKNAYSSTGKACEVTRGDTPTLVPPTMTEVSADRTSCLEGGERCKWQRDCCSGKCIFNTKRTFKKCKAATTTATPCSAVGEECLWQKECCSNRCGVDATSSTGKSCRVPRSEDAETCIATGQECRWMKECCSGRCISHDESSTGKVCRPELAGSTETVSTAATTEMTCLATGEDCVWQKDCCSERCGASTTSATGKACKPPRVAECRGVDAECLFQTDCCSDRCIDNVKSSTGRACKAAVTLPPSTADCIASNEMCQWQKECCSGKCVHRAGLDHKVCK